MKIRSLAFLAGILLTDFLAFCEEFVLLNVWDKTNDHLPNYENTEFVGPGIPKDWTQPVNYADGTWHQRFVVHSFGNGKYPYSEFLFMVTLRDYPGLDDAHPDRNIMTHQYADVGRNKVYTGSANVQTIRWDNGFEFNTDPAHKIRVQPRIYGSSATKYHNCTTNDGLTSEQVKWALPFEFEYQVVIVAKGSTFSGWENYPMKSIGATAAHTPMAQPGSYRIVDSRSAGANSNGKAVFSLRGQLLGDIAADNRIPPAYGAYAIPAGSYSGHRLQIITP